MFSLFTLFPKTSFSPLITGQIYAKLLLKVLDAVFEKNLIDVTASKVHISSSCLYIYKSIFDLKNGNIKCTTAKVEDEDSLHLSLHLIKSIGEGCSCWFIDYTTYF